MLMWLTAAASTPTLDRSRVFQRDHALSLFCKANAPQHICEPRVRAKTIRKKRTDFEETQVTGSGVVSLFKPFECLIFLTKGRVNFRYVTRRDVFSLRLLLQPVEDVPRLISSAALRINACERRQHARPVGTASGKFHRPLILRNGFLIHPLKLVSSPEADVSQGEVRVHLERFSQALYRPIVLTRKE